MSNNKKCSWLFGTVLLVIAATLAFARAPQYQVGGGRFSTAPVSQLPVGATQTLLPDGRTLVLGGQDAQGHITAIAAIEDSYTGALTPLASQLNVPRAYHVTSVLPNGTVLISGGIGAQGAVVTQAEIFDPQSEIFSQLAGTTPTARAFHSATLLTDGTLLIAGGVSSAGQMLTNIEIWDYRTGKASSPKGKLSSARRNHSAFLLGNGTVLLLGGRDDKGNPIASGDIYDPQTQSVASVATPETLLAPPAGLLTEVKATSPEDGATDVRADALISMRLSRPVLMQSINDSTIDFQGPSGIVPANIVGAEGGMLAFLTPTQPLLPGTTYIVKVSGMADATHNTVAYTNFSFTTAGSAPTDGFWTPTSDWNYHGPFDPKWQNLPPLQAPRGVTAIAGQVLKFDGRPLVWVAIELDDSSYAMSTPQLGSAYAGTKNRVYTDGTGRFLLKNVTAGHHMMMVIGTTVNSPSAKYGIYEIGVDAKPGITNALPYTIWSGALDTAHTVTISSPTTAPEIISSPWMPGLDLRIPTGTTITGYDGSTITQVNMTPIPLNRPPFPLPAVRVPIYFTVQPGAAYLTVNGQRGKTGAQLYYPNTFDYPVGSAFSFWNYDPGKLGWYVYGHGKVSADRYQVIPDPGVAIYQFTGAMTSPHNLQPPNPPVCQNTIGKPIDVCSGNFLTTHTDLAIQDVIPIALTRTYDSGDNIGSRAFGIGMNHTYDMYLVDGDNTCQTYTSVDLVLGDGSMINFKRITPGTDYPNALMQNTTTPGPWFGALLQAGPWTITTKDGTKYTFGDGNCVYTRSQLTALLGVQDRYGNSIALSRDSNFNLTQITSTNGRWIQLTYNSNNLVTQAKDNLGRTVTYSYDSAGRLTQFVDANGGVWNYTYDILNRMLTVQNPRGIFQEVNTYDTSNRVTVQTLADQSTWKLSYPTCQMNGCAFETDVEDPNDSPGNTITNKFFFNSAQFLLSKTLAYNQPEQEIYSYTLDPSTNLVTKVIDPLNHETDYTYTVDGLGNIQSIKALADTSNPATTQFTYDVYSQIASVTNPLNHTAQYQRDGLGNLTCIQDANGNQTLFTYFGNGQVQTISSVLNPQSQCSSSSPSMTTTFAYDFGDLSSVTDPMGFFTQFAHDPIGRLLSTTDPLQNITRYAYDPLDRVTTVTDPKSGVSSFTYDGNDNLLTVKDARQQGTSYQTSYQYDDQDRVGLHTDPLQRQESYQYDKDGNLTSFTDRRGIPAIFIYDHLDRRKTAAFNAVPASGGTCPNLSNYNCDSSIAYTYDGWNRPTQANDSIMGASNFTYTDATRTFEESNPLGNVTSVFDLAGRRTSMTVGGQTAVSYTYDNANRLTQIAQGSAAVGFQYDNINRRTLLTLANNVTQTYGYDNGSRLTSITYKSGGTTLGALNYNYDNAGRRTQVSGSYERQTLPNQIMLATYDYANELTQWNDLPLSYDSDGNMLNDGTNTFAWSARNQLKTVNGTSNFQYDGLGRRYRTNSNTQSLYDGIDSVQELASGVAQANRVTGGVDEFFSRADSTGTYYPLTDALGSAIALTNASGSVVTNYTYDPYGNTSISGNSNSNSVEYTGRENEGNGLYYYRARYYEPALARFISEDPNGLRGGINEYNYAYADPVNFLDPLGLGGAAPGQICTYNCQMMPNGLPPMRRPQDLQEPPTNEDYINAISGTVTRMADRQCRCLQAFDTSTTGKVVDFFSPLSIIPGMGPDYRESIVEDVGFGSAKFAVFKFFQRASETMAGTPAGSMSGVVAEVGEVVAKDVIWPVAVGAGATQVMAHAGCAIYSFF